MTEQRQASEDQRAATRQARVEHPATNIMAIAVAIAEAKASRLPGRVNGPADAYRHLVWVAEMARRFGPNNAGRYAELHEIQGYASDQVEQVRGRAPDVINNEAARTMDRRNNLIGVSIGQRAQSFEDVLRLSRATIDASPTDGSGGIAGAVWLPRASWRANPAGDSESWNWPHPDWSSVPRDHVEAYGWAGERHRFINHRLAAAERRSAIAAETRAEWTRLLEQDSAAGGGPVHVRAHQRDGHPVRAHIRAAP